MFAVLLIADGLVHQLLDILQAGLGLDLPLRLQLLPVSGLVQDSLDQVLNGEVIGVRPHLEALDLAHKGLDLGRRLAKPRHLACRLQRVVQAHAVLRRENRHLAHGGGPDPALGHVDNPQHG